MNDLVGTDVPLVVLCVIVFIRVLAPRGVDWRLIVQPHRKS